LKASQFLTKCRDCVARQKEKDYVVSVEDVCRFQQFRKLIKKRTAIPNKGMGFFIESSGFCDPNLDVTPVFKKYMYIFVFYNSNLAQLILE
jgi:hypothetical protein